FRSKHRTEVIDAAKRHGSGFSVQLAALREKYLLIFEIVDGKQRGGAFAGGRREDGRVGEDESLIVEEIADGGNHLVAHAENGLLALRANPQVPAIQQVIDAVLFRGNRISDRAADDLEIRHIDAEAARRSR